MKKQNEERQKEKQVENATRMLLMGYKTHMLLQHSIPGFLLQGVKYFQMGVAWPWFEDSVSSQES